MITAMGVDPHRCGFRWATDLLAPDQFPDSLEE